MLESAQGRRTRQRCDAIDRGLQCQVVPQLTMVVEILVAQRQPINPLPQQVHLAVGDEDRMPRIAEHLIERRGQSQASIGLAQQ
jgi:hypothetical protein